MLTTLRARYVFPVDQPPLADAVVQLVGGRITAVEPYHAGVEQSTIVDLGNAALLPGLVNAHTHLEFSCLDRPLGTPGMSLPEWIRQVVAYRSPAESLAVEAGLAESLCHGVTTLGEIAMPGWSPRPFDQSTLDVTVFYELIGMSADRTAQKLEECRKFLGQYAGESRWRAAISPHAPYSVRPQLFEQAIDEARSAGVPVAFHLAESREELQLLRDGSGPFRELLEDLGAWDELAIPHGTRPLDYLKRLSRAPRGLVIHGNYLDDEEIGFLAANAGNMPLIYCPRTHAYFQHAKYPLAGLLEAGVAVALGTDSRASNPDLSLLAEMRSVARRGDLPSRDVLRLGTLCGAAALGLNHELGSLSRGKRADLCAVALPDVSVADPHELLLHYDTPVIGVWQNGRRLL